MGILRILRKNFLFLILYLYFLYIISIFDIFILYNQESILEILMISDFLL